MHPSQRAATRQQQRVLDHAGKSDSLAFFNLLTGPQILDRVEALLPDHRERVFPPTETLSMFLAQALSADGSCRQAVDNAAVKRLIAGLCPHSTNTSAYVAQGAASWWHWRGRAVRLVDGATVTLADTEENQAAYPQPRSQKTGLGFPICRVVALLDAATGPCQGKGSDEQALGSWARCSASSIGSSPPT